MDVSSPLVSRAVRICSGLAAAVLLASQVAAAPTSPLIDAVRHGQTDKVRTLLKQPGTKVNATQPDGATALHWAAHQDDATLTDLLLRAGANPNLTNEYGVTPLSLAALNGSATTVQRLLTGGAAVNAPLPSGETAVMTAARVGRLDVVKALVAAGADVNAAEKQKGQTALMWAVAEQHQDVARFLLDNKARATARTLAGFTPLLFAVRMGHLELVKMLLAAGSGLEEEDATGATPLILATVRGHADLAMFLLDRGANAKASTPGFTALHWASAKWETQTTHDYPDAVGEWEALGGVKRNKLALIRSLIAHGADVNATLTKSPPRFGYHMFAQIKVDGATPFWLAAMSADLEVMTLLVASGANPTLTSADGTTPLMVAAGVGRVAGDSLIPEADSVAATKYCFERGNDVNAQNNTGYTALHGTAFYGLDDVATLLVSLGADMEIKNKKGETPLKIAEGTVNQAMLVSHPSTAAVLRTLAAGKAANTQPK